MRSNFVAILDANALFPAPLRDLLVELASAGLYRARWTNQITDEWVSLSNTRWKLVVPGRFNQHTPNIAITRFGN